MTSMRASRKNQRDLTEPEIVAALRQVPGITVFRLDQPADLLCGFRGRNYLLEVKTPTRKGGPPRRLTPAEAEFFEGWTGQASVVTTPEGALRVVLGDAWDD